MDVCECMWTSKAKQNVLKMSSHNTIPKITFTEQLLYFNIYIYPVILSRILSGMCYKVRSVRCMKTPSARQTSKLGKRKAALNMTITNHTTRNFSAEHLIQSVISASTLVISTWGAINRRDANATHKDRCVISITTPPFPGRRPSYRERGMSVQSDDYLNPICIHHTVLRGLSQSRHWQHLPTFASIVEPL